MPSHLSHIVTPQQSTYVIREWDALHLTYETFILNNESMPYGALGLSGRQQYKTNITYV